MSEPTAPEPAEGIDPATLHAREHTGEGLPNVHQAMAQAMALVRAVGKWGTNKEQGYSFRSIDHFMTALNPAMAAAGVHVVPRVLQRLTDDTHTTRSNAIMRWVDVEMAFTFYGPDGSCVEAVTWGEARDSADKATNKAMTGAFKYAIMQAFMVPTADLQDADRDSPESQPAAQQQEPSEAEQQEARRVARERALATATADAAVVDELRSEALRIADAFKNETRRAKLLQLFNRAGEAGALGCMVELPAAWSENGEATQVHLHQLIAGAATITVQSGEGDQAAPEPEAVQGTVVPPQDGQVHRATTMAEDDPWATSADAPTIYTDSAQVDEAPPLRGEAAQQAAVARARSARKGAKA